MTILSVQVSYKKQTTFGIIGIVILLLCIEAVANVWWATQIHCEFEKNEIFQNIDEEKKKQMCLDFYNIKTTGDQIISSQSSESITINSLGFRGDEFFNIKPSDTYRIFTIGGSTMFGAGATSDETTISSYMQNILNEKNFGFDVEVINAGIQGADSNTELSLIEQKLVRLSPDLLIIYDGWNDLRAHNTSMKVNENWKTMCEFGRENGFDVVISLQPIAGFGNKALTTQELTYMQTGKDYSNNLLIESLSIYQDYAKNLSEIKSCTKTFDLRDVFDTESEPIYWDQGHVSDRGNSIVAKSLSNKVFSIISEKTVFNTFTSENNIEKASSLFYEDREIVVSVKLLSANESENKILEITTYDNTNKEDILNVTYFIVISKDNDDLLNEYFFAEDGVLVIDIKHNDESLIKVIGEKQYDNNAYVMPGSKYSPEMSGVNLTSITPLQIIGPIFDTEATYMFDIELRTIDNRNNWVFSLSDFHSEIIIEKNTITEHTTENQIVYQNEDLLRKIFSYYKTPILINEIFN